MINPTLNRLLKTLLLGSQFLILWDASTLHAAESGLQFSRIPFSLPIDTAGLTAVDFDGDGLIDLLAERENELRLYVQSASGFDFAANYLSFPVHGDSLGWDLRPRREAGQDTTMELLTLTADEKNLGAANGLVQAYRLQRSEDGRLGWSAPVTLLSGLRSPIGRGVTRLAFARDINSDEQYDLILPNADRLAIYLASADGFASPLIVQTQSRLNTVLFSPELDRRIGQALSIPGLKLRDVNGDGAADLITDTEESLSVFLADPSSDAVFPVSASIAIDRAAIRERLGEFDIENLDFANLTGVLALSHEETLEDIDDDGIDDLLLREGGKVSIFAGTASGIDQSAPRQVLRSGGNVLSTFLHDEDEDGLKDLWLWRVEPISVGDIFLWLALSGSISLEAFVYRNDGESFARRPARKVSVALKFPSVIRLASTLSDIADSARASEDAADVLSIEAQLDASSKAYPNADDVLMLANGQLTAYLNVVETAEADGFLAALGYSRGRDDYTIDLKAVIDAAVAESDPLQGAERGPDYQLDVATSAAVGGLLTARINADALEDIFVFTAMTPDSIEGILLLSN